MRLRVRESSQDEVEKHGFLLGNLASRWNANETGI